MTPPDTRFFFRLIDRRGILQHSRFSTPKEVTGYSLDDNARALIVSTWHFALFKKEKFRSLTKKFLRFLKNQQARDGSLRNYLFISFGNRFLSREVAEDSFGETIWSLGFVLTTCQDKKIQDQAQVLFKKFYPQVEKVTSLRTKAYCLIGLYYYLEKHQDPNIRPLALKLANELKDIFDQNKQEDWLWFENSLTYANAILPWALFLGFEISKNRAFLKAAKTCFGFLVEKTTVNHLPSPIGQRGWLVKDGQSARFDQQPIEAGYMVLASLAAHKATGQKKYLKLAQDWFGWFQGSNLVGLSLIDKKDGGCYDGLEAWKVNLNKGAESTLCYLLAHLALVDYEKRSL
jgi:hypothetical protein